MKTRFRPYLSALFCFSPSLAALGQSAAVIVGTAQAQRRMEVLLPKIPGETTSATFATGPVTDWLNVFAFPTKVERQAREPIRVREMVSCLTLQTEQTGNLQPVRMRSTEKGIIAYFSTQRGTPCRVIVGLKPGTRADVSERYRLVVQTAMTHEPAPTVSLLWLLTLLLGIGGAFLYNRRKQADW